MAGNTHTTNSRRDCRQGVRRHLKSNRGAKRGKFVIEQLLTVLTIGSVVTFVCIPIAIHWQSTPAAQFSAGTAMALFPAAQIIKLIS